MKYIICCNCEIKTDKYIKIRHYFDYTRGNTWVYYCLDCYKKIKEI